MEKFNKVKKHEVSLDVVATLASLGINPRYEYVLGRYAGVGIDLNIGIQDDEDFNYIEKFSVTPILQTVFLFERRLRSKRFLWGRIYKSIYF